MGHELRSATGCANAFRIPPAIEYRKARTGDFTVLLHRIAEHDREALEVLRRSYSVWLRMGDPGNIWAAETKYCFGRAWIAVGDVTRGRRMVTEAREILARSPNATQRKLADQPVP